MQDYTSLRNIAIIAHVDHGKTTLIDNLLQQSGTFHENQVVNDRIMDSNVLEKERGITILAKCTAILRGKDKINIIDTPGHADFGGEVERILSMVDSVLLLVDSAEGVMPQTKFVLSKALKAGLKPIVVINKVDRKDAQIDVVLEGIMELFMALDATEEQFEFPVLYASGRNGWCVKEQSDIPRDPTQAPECGLNPMFETIISHVPPVEDNQDAPFSMLATMLTKDNFLGRLLIGKVYSGIAKTNETVNVLDADGNIIEKGRISKLLCFSGLDKEPTDTVKAGDIAVIAGLNQASVAHTIADPSVTTPIDTTPIDPPTIAITIAINDSPLAGQEGDKVTSTMIGDRLMAEAETNVAITVERDENDAFTVGGRGELQLGVLIENMRREGFELSVSRPHVMFKEEDGQKLEPCEEVTIDVDEEHSGVVMDKMSRRKAKLIEMQPPISGKSRLIFHAPSRGLIGYQGEFLADTRGTGILNRIFHSYIPYEGSIKGRANGVLISTETGAAVAYALFNLQDRGSMFVKHNDKIYSGMIVGEHNRGNDLEVNVMKGKKLTNMRASGSDENVILTPPVIMTLEEMIAYIANDELVEVTPQSLRLRKKYLDPNERKRNARKED